MRFLPEGHSFSLANRSSEVGSPCRSFARPSSEVGSTCRSFAGPNTEVGSPCRGSAGPSSEVGSPCRSFAGPSSEVGSPCRSLAEPSSEVGSLIYTGGGRPPSKGFDFVRPFSRSADLERARLCPRLIKWFFAEQSGKAERDMLFILSGFLFYGVREKRRAVPSAVAEAPPSVVFPHPSRCVSARGYLNTNFPTTLRGTRDSDHQRGRGNRLHSLLPKHQSSGRMSHPSYHGRIPLPPWRRRSGC